MKIVYRAHNQEAGIWKRMAGQASSAAARIFLNYQARLVRRFEAGVLRAADGVAPVSAEDLRALQDMCPVQCARVVPIGYQFDELEPAPCADRMQILFLGRLDWRPNYEGLVWFLEKVWPEVLKKRTDLELIIAGSGAAGVLDRHLPQPNCVFLGRVEHVRDLYKTALLSVVPVFFGSGTRVKVIEAAGFGRACLSTQLGVEGVGLQAGISYYHAETTQEWVETLVRLNRDHARQVGRNACAAAKETFELDRTVREFRRLLDQVSGAA